MTDPAKFLSGATRETALRRDASGRWFDGPDALEHPGLVRAFDAWIDRAEDGRYCLRNALGWAYVRVEGAPVFVRHARLVGPALALELSDGREEDLDPSTLRQGRDGALYCQVRGGRLPARFDRAAMHELAPLLGGTELAPVLILGDQRYSPPVVDEPLPWQPTQRP